MHIKAECVCGWAASELLMCFLLLAKRTAPVIVFCRFNMETSTLVVVPSPAVVTPNPSSLLLLIVIFITLLTFLALTFIFVMLRITFIRQSGLLSGSPYGNLMIIFTCFFMCHLFPWFSHCCLLLSYLCPGYVRREDYDC